MTRRLPREDIPTFNSLIKVCRKIFRIEKSQKLIITYIDDDNDIISIGSDSELVEAFRQLSPQSSALKLFVHIEKGIYTIIYYSISKPYSKCLI